MLHAWRTVGELEAAERAGRPPKPVLVELRAKQLAELRAAEGKLRRTRERVMVEGAAVASGGEREGADDTAHQTESVVKLLAMLEGYLVPSREALAQAPPCV
jgi:hypothetical protein